MIDIKDIELDATPTPNGTHLSWRDIPHGEWFKVSGVCGTHIRRKLNNDRWLEYMQVGNVWFVMDRHLFIAYNMGATY